MRSTYWLILFGLVTASSVLISVFVVLSHLAEDPYTKGQGVKETYVFSDCLEDSIKPTIPPQKPAG